MPIPGKQLLAYSGWKRAVIPQETDPDSPVSVQEPPVEAWVSGGLLQGWGPSAAVHAEDLLKEMPLSSLPPP